MCIGRKNNEKTFSSMPKLTYQLLYETRFPKSSGKIKWIMTNYTKLHNADVISIAKLKKLPKIHLVWRLCNTNYEIFSPLQIESLLSGQCAWCPHFVGYWWSVRLERDVNKGELVALVHFEDILPKGSYLPCVSMAGRALLAGYHRFCWSVCISTLSLMYDPVTGRLFKQL